MEEPNLDNPDRDLNHLTDLSQIKLPSKVLTRTIASLLSRRELWINLAQCCNSSELVKVLIPHPI